MSVYSDVFWESALVSALVPFAHDPTFFAMHSFGTFDMVRAAEFAVLGAIVGFIFLFSLGRFLLKIYRKKNERKYMTRAQYNDARRSFYRYFIIILPFCWMPLLNFLVFVAGFLDISAWLVFPLVIGGKIAYYGYYVIY